MHPIGVQGPACREATQGDLATIRSACWSSKAW